MLGLGVLVAITTAVANAFAVVLQAGEDRRTPPSQSGRPSLLIGLAHRPRWLAGTGLMIVAWPLHVLALALAPITVVQPLLSSSQLVLLGMARVKLRERVGSREALGALRRHGGACGQPQSGRRLRWGQRRPRQAGADEHGSPA
jgi:drug/metabolite transporter (DMT)-like permease